MILQSLYDYEKRYEEFHDDVKKGCERVGLKFLVEIDPDGFFVQLIDTREGKKGKEFLVPESVKRSGSKAYEKPNMLWDDVKNVLGYHKEEKTDAKNKSEDEKCALKLEWFIKKVEEIRGMVHEETTCRALDAVLAFYGKGEREKVCEDTLWEECIGQTGCNISFRISSQGRPVASLPEIQKIAGNLPGEENGENGICLITGEKGPMVRIHPETPIIGGSPKGKLLSFQKKSGYDSYYKEQGYNAPVSEEAARLYGMGLNRLLKNKKHRTILLDTSYVYWSVPENTGEKPHSENDPVSEAFQWALQGVPEDTRKQIKEDPDRSTEIMHAYMEHLKRGLDEVEGDSSFCLLGLSPNQTRISVRLWMKAKISDFRKNIKSHLADSMVLNFRREKKNFSLYRLLQSIALNGKTDKLPPAMGTAYLNAIVTGGLYPMTVYQAALIRMRAERKMRQEWAFIIRGALNRWAELNMYGLGKENFEMALDENNTNPGYVCGRIFAVLEKIQKDALGGNLNTTIGDRYYGSASITPGAVLPHLIRLSRHHLKKLNPGAEVNYNKMLGAMAALLENNFPKHLNLIGQGAFALGYYHQQQDLYTKKTDKDETAGDNEE